MPSARETYNQWKQKVSEGITSLARRSEPQPDYIYPCDSYINTLLSSYFVKKSLQAIAEKYYSAEIEAIYKSDVRATEESYPLLYDAYVHCLSELSVTNKVPALYISNQLQGINALSIEDKGEQLILISRQAVAQLSEEELHFVLGHEISHCLSAHMVCHTVLGLIHDMNNANEILGSLLTDMIEVPLVQWFHCSEFTADRAGLLCCGSLDVAKDVFVRLGINRETSAYEQYNELSTPHPLLQTRWKMLEQFADSRNIK